MKIDGGLMTTDLRDAARFAVHAERRGYVGLWTAEAGHDPYLPAALAATATERITIGSNIAVAFPRSPLVHAQVAWRSQATWAWTSGLRGKATASAATRRPGWRRVRGCAR